MGKISNEIFMINSLKIFQPRRPHPLTSLISTFYNCGHFILLVPFKVKFNPTSGHHFIERASKFRKMIVLLLQLSAMIPTLWIQIIDPIIQGKVLKKKLTILIFSLVLICATNFYIVTWRGIRTLEKLLQQLDILTESLDNLGVKMPSPRRMRIISGILALFFFVWGIIDVSTLTLRLHEIGPAESFQKSVVGVQSSFRLSAGEGRNLTLDQTPWFQLTLSVIVIVGRCVACVGIRLPDLFCFSYALVLLIIMRHFMKHLDSEITDPYGINSTMDMYDQITEVTRGMDKAVGTIVFCSCFCLLPYNSMQFLAIFMSDGFQVIRVLSFFLTFGSTLIVAAEANAKVGEFVGWLQRSQGRFRFRDMDEKIGFQQRLSIILGQVHQVGLRGRAFTLTYAFVGNLASLVITYAIVFVQLQPSH